MISDLAEPYRLWGLIMKSYFLGCRPGMVQTGYGANWVWCKLGMVQTGYGADWGMMLTG